MKLSPNPIWTKKLTTLQNCCETSKNHRLPLALLSLSSERHFGALTVKCSLNSTTTQEIASFQITVRRLQSPFLAILTVLIIMATFLRS